MRYLFAPFALVLLAGCASTHSIEPQLATSSTDFGRAERIEISLSNFAFAPSDIQLSAGKAYELVLTDTASGGHDFTAPEFFAAAKIKASDASKVASGQVELSGGQSVTIDLVPTAGNYKLTCTHLGHVALGMSGTIKVS
ncbi:copper-binding protein [Altererythrobacter salegens]|uniref:Copper-binding protein n=1 Tax=Croceibacterium salegens TaxID=1737568 RepID=A0A6I4SY07_9SPHN|nr:plastocyanin/azurin family copper-binding protein [Croceibacterium salegens]MXO59202.1 copper-binding protein [Croceibacterium salegens]